MNQRTSFIVVSCLALGCTHYANWHDFARSPGYRVPASIPIVVSRSDAVRAADDGGFVDATLRVVEDDLRERGVEGRVLAASASSPPSPRVELAFVVWIAGSGAVPHFSAGMFGRSYMVVEVKALSAEGTVLLDGRVDGADIAYNASSRDAAAAAGHSIARALADAKFAPRPAGSLETSLP